MYASEASSFWSNFESATIVPCLVSKEISGFDQLSPCCSGDF